jgi:hypothetical protein
VTCSAGAQDAYVRPRSERQWHDARGEGSQAAVGRAFSSQGWPSAWKRVMARGKASCHDSLPAAGEAGAVEITLAPRDCGGATGSASGRARRHRAQDRGGWSHRGRVGQRLPTGSHAPAARCTARSPWATQTARLPPQSPWRRARQRETGVGRFSTASCSYALESKLLLAPPVHAALQTLQHRARRRPRRDTRPGGASLSFNSLGQASRPFKPRGEAAVIDSRPSQAAGGLPPPRQLAGEDT